MTLRPYYWLLLLGCLALGTACTPDVPADPEVLARLPEHVDYNFHVRPILSDKCFVCHGPDASTREAGLRLDDRAFATARRKAGGPAIVPGSARRSLLVQRITARDPDVQMPPPASNKTLTSYEVALLARWISQGAAYKPHWSLLPPEPQAVPDVPEGWTAKNAIDHFVGDRLLRAGLAPAPAASKETLIRRLSYVLTGLPPAPEAVDAFVGDEAPDAYERLVDGLLASPRFGERWARHWMDLVRYADSKGHEFDYTIQGAWRYRDYLIRAFNADVPYDRLVTEHLAGDLVDVPRLHPADGYDESVIGTLFYSLGEGTHSPVDLRKDEADRIDNIIDVTTKTFQGLTVACARCHDHKFDPIPTTDYYALYGIFESTRFAPTPLLTARTGARLDSVRALQAALRRHLAARWLAQPGTAPIREAALGEAQQPAMARSDSLLGDFRTGSFGGWYPHGPAFKGLSDAPAVDFEQIRLRGVSPGLVSSRTAGAGLPGALRSPTFTLAHDSLLVLAAGRGSLIRIVIDNFQLIRYPIYGGLEKEVNSPALHPYRFDVSMWKGRKAYVELLVGTYDKDRYISEQHQLAVEDDAYIEAAYAVAYMDAPPALEAVQPIPIQPTTTAQAAVHAWVEGRATPSQRAQLDALLRSGRLDGSLADAAPLVQRLQALTAHPDTFAIVQAVTDGDAVESPVFVRGNYQTLDSTLVPHRFLTALAGEDARFSTTGSGRRALARAVTDPQNPLTARVMVNRLWHHVFGRGLVETVDNFGAQGKPPSHPALLDYLALQFVEQGWSIKAMLRAMVLSHTFRQHTTPEPAADQADPLNLLLHHYPVRRLEAEAVRDAILAVSGRLDTTMYGPPVPVHLTAFMNGRGRPEASGPLDGAGRRSLYLAVRRNFLSPLLLTFDQPLPFSTVGRRNESNVPAQALTLLNDPFVAEQAAYWGTRLAALGLPAETRIDYIYRTALARPPTAAERTDARAFLQRQARQHGLTEAEALRDPRPWQALAHVIFNLKAFIYLT